MKDTLEPDLGELAREYWLALPALDQLRWLDARIEEVGGHAAPLPSFGAARKDAAWWCEYVPAETRKIFLAAIMATLSEGEKMAFVKWAEKHKKEAEKAEASSG